MRDTKPFLAYRAIWRFSVVNASVGAGWICSPDRRLPPSGRRAGGVCQHSEPCNAATKDFSLLSAMPFGGAPTAGGRRKDR